MKLKRFIGIAALAIITLVNVNVVLAEYDDFGNWIETGDQEPGGEENGGGTAKWIKDTDDCTIILQGEAGLPIAFLGHSYTIPAGGKLTVTFRKASVDCRANGDMQCIYRDCYMFYSGSN
jgi:hypothetical protein